MHISEMLKQKNMTKYRLSKKSGVPFTTVSEITTGKTKIENCTGSTLFKLARALDVTVEDLLADSMIYRPDFSIFKGNICHLVKNMGDLTFIIDTLENDTVRTLYNRGWYPECLYLLAMLDYLSRENGLPLCNEYNDLRCLKLREPIYSSSVVAMSILSGNDEPMKRSREQAEPEFLRHNIVEGEIRNVC